LQRCNFISQICNFIASCVDIFSLPYYIFNDGEVHSVPIKDGAKYARNPCHHCCDYTSVFADISVGSVGAPDGWNSVFIRTEIGEKYFDVVREDMEIIEDPKPGLELVEKLIETKRKNNAKHFAEVCKEFSFETESAMNY
jgi:F420H2 dehydrogenase subunit F